MYCIEYFLHYLQKQTPNNYTLQKFLIQVLFFFLKYMTITLTKNPIQIKFFERLRTSVPANISLAADIAEILEISADGAYRRMRGESVLSMDELVLLCRHYKVSPDLVVHAEDTGASFTFRKLVDKAEGLKEYINSILEDMQTIYASNPKQIIYAANDLPVFHQFRYPHYAAFKIFSWKRTILNITTTETLKFNISNMPSEISDACKRIAELYTQIPSIEIWHEDTMDSNLKLIEYAWDAGLFSCKEDALTICKEFSELLASVEKQAARSSKFMKEEKWAENEGNFTMYQSELLLSNNHIFVTRGVEKKIYLSHNTFNTMATTNSSFCNETENWLKSLMQKSLMISGTAEKQRHRFFKNGQNKIDELVARIK